MHFVICDLKPSSQILEMYDAGKVSRHLEITMLLLSFTYRQSALPIDDQGYKQNGFRC